jgi:hypothetical protein
MPTILLPRNINEIKKQLSKDDRVVVTTCSMCPEKCGIKVRETVKDIAKSAKVVGVIKFPTGCNAGFVEEYKERFLGMNPTAVVVLDCDGAALAQKWLYPQMKVVKGCTSVGFGYGDPEGGFIECAWPFAGHEKYKGMRIKLYEGSILREGSEDYPEQWIKHGTKFAGGA